VFHPPTIEPHAKFLPSIRGLFAALRNPLEYWSEPFFEESMHTTKFMGRTFLTIMDPELTKQILVDRAFEFRKSPFIEKILRPALGDGLLTATGNSWRTQRPLVEQALSSDRINACVQTFIEAGAVATDRLLQNASQAQVDVLTVMEDVLRDAVIETLVGAFASEADRDRFRSEVAVYVASLGQVDLLDLAGAPDWLPRPWKSRGYAAARRLRKLIERMIERQQEDGNYGGELLRPLMHAEFSDSGTQLSSSHVVDNVLTLISAGMETTPLAITWTLSILANLPELQQLLAEEVEVICRNGSMTAESILGLDLHSRVIQEALRLYPPVASIGLSPIAATEIAEVPVKPGDHITIAIYLMHRHKRLWDNPSAFDPDRFTLGRSKNRHRFAYLPFGRGKRMCVGMKLATLEITTVLASTIRQVCFAPDPSHVVRPVAKIALRPQGGMPLYISPRG
jgi:cytochrome P450